MRAQIRVVVPAICFFSIAASAQSTDLSGKWLATLVHHGRPEYDRLTLKADGARWTGDMFGQTFAITSQGSEIQVRCRKKDGSDCGAFNGHLNEGVMNASGKIFDEEATWHAERAPGLERSATRHEFVPKVYYNHFSGLIEPALHVKPGDTVHTATVDAGGVAGNGAHLAAGGNPLAGPFYIDGAWPGDTLVIKLNRVRLNRDSAGTYSNSVVLSALDPYYVRDQKEVENFDSTWKLDREAGTAVLTKPT